MILLSPSDFTLYFRIPQSLAADTSTLIQNYIDRYEKHYLCKLLGVTLAELFIADLANASQDARFSVIEDAFYLDDPNGADGDQFHSLGMKDMLKAMVFYHFVTEEHIRLSQNGVTISIDEGVTILNATGAYRFAERKFNESLDTYEAIQWYCTEFAEDDYPEYNGAKMDARWSTLL